MIKRSWVEINLKVIQDNYCIYKSIIPRTQEIMAVVKADAYGHGESEIALALQDIGCCNFAVSNIEEGISLRKAGIKGQVLILGYTPISSIHELLSYDITQTIISENYAERLSYNGIKAQFALDTGMNRIGIDADKPEECEKIIRKYSNKLVLTGIFTHLCVADTESEDEFTKGQTEKFADVTNRIRDLNLPYIHCMNSAGGLWHEAFGNLVRVGIVLYGLKPNYSKTLPGGIKPALEWKSVISMIKMVHSNETIGYGRSFLVKKDMKIATIPTGYADGYSRALSNKGFVLIHGKKAPVVGRVCMDQMMVDVTDIPEAMFEDEVLLLGEDFTADDMALMIGTIGYEVICNISKRVPRIYK